MDIPETMLTLGTQDDDKQNTTQKTKKKSNTDPTKNREWTQAPAKGKRHLLIIQLFLNFFSEKSEGGKHVV